MKKLERIHFISKPERLLPVRQFVRTLARQQGCCDENLEHMVMAINEACMNVIQHAYHGADDGEIVIEFWQQGEELLIRIIDYAEAVELSSIKSRELEDVRPGGLGVHLIHKVMDSVEYAHNEGESGNVLEMRKTLNKKSSCDVVD